MAFAGTSGGVPFVRVPLARSTFFWAKIGGWRGRSADDGYGGCVVPRQQKAPGTKARKWSDEVAILPRSTGAAGYLGSGRSLGGCEKPPRREGRNVGPGERMRRPKGGSGIITVFSVRLDEEGSGRVPQRGEYPVGIGKPAGWCEDGEVEETAGVIGSCLQLYGAPIRVSGSDESERA